jgi:glutamate 5-kinase
MKKSLKYRECMADVRRVVVKIGSRVLVQKSGRPDIRVMRRLTGDLANMARNGHEVLVVTSGAVGAGMEVLGMRQRPQSLPELQMAAAVGQSRLMARYCDLFKMRKCMVGQVLLTHDDFHHKIRLSNARRTMETLLRHKVIPIINENDVVADEEIRADLALGDNDLLASLVVKLIRADLLIMLSTTNGVKQRDSGGRMRRIPYLETIGRKTFQLAQGGPSALSRGGMHSKLKAAQNAAAAGCSVVIAEGRKAAVLPNILAGRDEGTLILASAL